MSKRARELYEFSCKYTNAVHEGPTLMTLSKPNYHPKVPPPNTITLGLREELMNFGGTYSLHGSWKAENARSERAMDIMLQRLNFNVGPLKQVKFSP